MLRFGRRVYTNKPDYKRNLEYAPPSVQSQLKIQVQRECLTIQEPPFRQISSIIKNTSKIYNTITENSVAQAGMVLVFYPI